MNNVRLWWLTPPGEAERPTQTGFFVWKGRGHQTARIVGVLSSVAGCVSPQDPRVVEVRVGEGIDPWQRLTAPEHLRGGGMSRALTDAALRASPLICQPGMTLAVDVLEADTDAIALIVELYPWGEA